MDNDSLKREELIEEIEVNSIEEIYKKVIYSGKYNGYIFRGQGEANHKLLPTLLRNEYRKKFNKQSDLCIAELRALIMFFREANNHGLYVPPIPVFYKNYLSNYFDINEMLNSFVYYWLPEDIIELAILAQHYGVKTRLLDWTRDIRIALYFACKDESDDAGKAAVWCIDARWLQEYKRKDRTTAERIANVEASHHTSDYEERRKLIEVLQDDSFPLRFFISSYSNNANLNAQQGVLSMWQHNMALDVNENIPANLNNIREEIGQRVEKFLDGNIVDDSKSLDELLLGYFNKKKARINVYRTKRDGKPLLQVIKFDKELKKDFLDLLQKEGYDDAFVFPGYTSIAKLVNQKL